MSVYIPIDLRHKVRAHFGNCCAYCRTAENLTATVFEIEHIVPRADGGTTIFENLCFSCPMCNRYKSDSSSGIDPITNVETPLFNPQQDAWAIHFSWNEDKTEVVGLSPVGRATVATLKMNRAAMIRVRRMWVLMGEHPQSLE